MLTGWGRPRAIVLALALAGTGLAAFPAVAQSADDDARLRKIEAEVRALQRKVFPGGDGRFFTPEVLTPGATGTGSTAGVPATSAVTDILGRLDSLEAQIAQITARTEETTNAIAQMKQRLDELQPPAAPAVQPVQPSGVIPQSAVAAPAASTASAAFASTGPTTERLAAVQAIAKPQTDDAGDDEYSYGFRLWDAKFYPEAEQQLRLFIDKYPSHWRMSYARNLLGRAYLDDGKPREAAPWFLQNYQANKQGERAGDSLLYLAEAMIAIKDTSRACIALAEFSDTYPALATGRLSAQYEADRKKVTCN